MISTLLRRLIKIPLVLPFPDMKEHSVCILIYHKVGGELDIEIDLPFDLFRRQMEHLAVTGRTFSLDKAVGMLKVGAVEKHTFVVTFDDGFQDLYTRAFPVLRDLGIPFTVYPTTRFLEEGIPDGYGVIPREVVKPLTWEMLGEMAASGLAAVGGHTHSHRDCDSLEEGELREDLERSHELFLERLGLRVQHFAYPRGRWDEKSEKAVAKYYKTAVLGDGRRANACNFIPLRIPRIPVRRSDGWFYFVGKTKGWPNFEEDFYRGGHRLFGG